MSHPGGVNDSHLLNIKETKDKHCPYAPSWLAEGFNISTDSKLCFAYICISIISHIYGTYNQTILKCLYRYNEYIKGP